MKTVSDGGKDLSKFVDYKFQTKNVGRSRFRDSVHRGGHHPLTNSVRPKKVLGADVRPIFEKQIGSDDRLQEIDVLLSPENASKVLDVSRKFIYELIARKEIASVKLGNRLRRIRLSELELWLSKPK